MSGIISQSCESTAGCGRLDRRQIEIRLNACPCLPSLASIDAALKDLLVADQRYTSQIAEIIERDPSLATRLLRLVHSVYYDISTPIKSIEEAVFYLGMRHIRQLAMMTTVVEDMEKLPANRCFPWREFWRHSIATALMTREVMELVQASSGESDYLAGLIHDVGTIVMAAAFPSHFHAIYGEPSGGGADLLETERAILGADHAELGAMYLRKQMLPEAFVEVVRCHHEPGLARHNGRIAAAVQVADLLVRGARIGESGAGMEVSEDAWLECEGGRMLLGGLADEQTAAIKAALRRSLERIPVTLEHLI
jgi:HD-like signal output (HDOD) protein